MRPIASNNNLPTEKCAKWLVSEFSTYEQPIRLSVKNSFDCIEKIKDETINDDEILVSSDVESLFPSIPMEKH